MDFKSNNLDDILTSVGYFPFWSYVNTWSANQSLYLFWMNDFIVLFTNKSNGQDLLVRLRGTTTTSQLFSAHSFFNVLLPCPWKVSMIIKTCCSKSNFYFVWCLPSKEKLFIQKNQQISLCLTYGFLWMLPKKKVEKNTWTDFVRLSLHKLAGLPKNLQCNWHQKWLSFGAYHPSLLWGCSLHLLNWTCISLH